MDSLKSDMQLLLDSLKCSPCDKDQQIDALKTLAMLCNNGKYDCIKLTSHPILAQSLIYALNKHCANFVP